MAAIQSTSILRSLRFNRTPRPISLASSRSLHNSPRFYAGSSYGDGEGDPKGQNPQDQGSSTITSDKEHPGPPPPDVGDGTGGGPTEKVASGHNSKSSDSSAGRSTSKGTQGAQPRILTDDAPHPDQQSDDVKTHNAEMKNRHEKPHEGSGDGTDTVGKGYWKGQGGADRQP